MAQSTADKACEIIRRTNDGDDLAPEHLYLVQEMVNGHLNEQGEIAFEELYQSVLRGYKKPWFHGIEHLTRDHEGYIYWKGKVVEHYDSPWAGTAEGREAANRLAARCRHLESIGVEPSSTTAIWHWEKYKP